MITELIHDRGRGPEIVGTRITVYNLLTDLLDPDRTEAEICRIYELTPEQVAAARAYILQHADVVLARHLEIEAKMATGNPPAVIEQAKQTHAVFLRFKAWLAEQKTADTEPQQNGSGRLPTFKEWLAEQESLTEKRA